MGYTPGPWIFIAPDFIGTDEEDYQTIAYVDDHRNRKQRSASEHIANAYLISAAPKLLEALQLAEATIERLAPDGSRATQGTRDVISIAIMEAKVGSEA